MTLLQPATLSRRLGLCLVLGAVWIAGAAGCQFDSSLEQARCEEEGTRSDGRVCRDGYWVVDDAMDVSDTPAEDTRSDVASDTIDAPDTGGDIVTDGDGDADTDADGDDADACTSEESLCDGLDEDCDGLIDEDFVDKGEACETGDGVCRSSGTWVCNSTRDGLECDATPPPGTAEVCDQIDNDCDGMIDEGVGRNYHRDSDGDTYGRDDDLRMACSPSGEYTATRGDDCDDSDPLVNPGMPELCNDGIDNNCNGVVNETCQCNYLQTDTGVCSMGTRDAVTGDCEPPVSYEQSEQTCNDGLDNDCNGRTDNDQGCPCVFMNVIGVCGPSSYNAAGTCQPTPNYEDPESSCGDGRDNDCDGLTDCMDQNCPGACLGEPCMNDNNCASGYCNPAGECGLTQCGNGRKDANEVLTDCGSPACLLCAGGSCTLDDDCKSLDCDEDSGICN